MPKRARIIKSRRLQVRPTNWQQVVPTGIPQRIPSPQRVDFALYFVAFVLLFAVSFALSASYQVVKPKLQEIRMQR